MMERPTRDTDSSVTVSDRLCCSCIGLKRFGGGWEAGRVSSRGSRSIASGQEHEGGMRSGAHKSWVKTTTTGERNDAHEAWVRTSTTHVIRTYVLI
jgi:hypothetical protein